MYLQQYQLTGAASARPNFLHSYVAHAALSSASGTASVSGSTLLAGTDVQPIGATCTNRMNEAKPLISFTTTASKILFYFILDRAIISIYIYIAGSGKTVENCILSLILQQIN